MDPSSLMNEDIGEIAEPNCPDLSQDQTLTQAAERDDVFYFETVTFQVRLI